MNGYRLNGNRPHHSGTRGFTLVELMVAMAIGLIIVAGVGYIYLQGNSGYRVQNSQARLQENARLLHSIMTRDLTVAGHFGCVKGGVDTIDGFQNIRITAAQPLMTANVSWMDIDRDQTNNNSYLDPSFMVQSFDDGAGWPVSASIAAKRIVGTDTLLVLRGGDDSRHLTEPVKDEEEFRIASVLPGVTTNGRLRTMVLSNCATAEIVKPTIRDGGLTFNVANTYNVNTASTSPDPDPTTRNKIRGKYDPRSTITTFEPVSYFIGDSVGSNGTTVPSLYRLQTIRSSPTDSSVGLWDPTPDVILEGVESLRVRFIRPSIGGNLQTAAEVTAANAWADVGAVRIDATLVSDFDGVRTESTTQTVGSVTTTDRRLRLNTSFVVNVRNPRQI
jgi:type IV pilus assembly protein PilW